MSLPLFMRGIKSSWKMLLVFCAVLTMYFVIIITMFDPEIGSALLEFEKAMPELMAMVGMSTADATLVSFMASYLYGFIMLVFPMIFSIVVANRLLAHHVDHGSMAYLLAAPVKRTKIVFTQMKVLATGIFLLVAYAAAMGIAACQLYFPGQLAIPDFLMMNLGVLALQLFIGGICFLSSSIFNDTKYSIAFGAGIPALGFIVQMMASSGEALKTARYATFFTLFNPKGLAEGNTDAYWGIAALAGGALLLFALAIVIFRKKDIPV